MTITDITGILMPLSYALQIVGATFLLVCGFKQYQIYEKRQQTEPKEENIGTLTILNADAVTVGTDYTNAAVSEFSKIISFLEICFGYVLAIIVPHSRWTPVCQLICTVVLVAVFFTMNKMLQNCIKRRFDKLYQRKCV